VRRELIAARRTLATARGRTRGLRGPLPEQLAGMEDDQVTWAAIELVWDAVTIYEGVQILDAGLALATRPQRGLYAVWWTISEVRNGGFAQYYWNSTGVVAAHAIDGLRLLEASDAAAIVERSLEPFAAVDASDPDARRAVLQGLPDDQFSALDERFWEIYPEVFARAAAHVRAHPEDFFE
jgi:hypothetical protein